MLSLFTFLVLTQDLSSDKFGSVARNAVTSQYIILIHIVSNC